MPSSCDEDQRRSGVTLSGRACSDTGRRPGTSGVASSPVAKADDPIPTSRWRRAAKIGGLAAKQGAKQSATRAANVVRTEEAASRAMDKRQVEAAEQMVEVLGTMKGAAMKIGQVLSFLDVGLVPEEHREAFQTKLAALRDAAPKVDFPAMKKVLEAEYGERLDDVFESFDPVPIAAASIGQVYKARLDDGRDVAVKVQYPGVAGAVRADMQNLGLILTLLKRIAPGLDAKAIGDEIRARIDEELDYELEAANQRALARIYRGHPFIVIPDVVTSLSHEKVVVTEFVHGRGFEEMLTLDQEARDRLGEIVFRFYFGGMYRHRAFSGDPHPGNMVLLDDDRVAFLDFGLFKRISEEAAEVEMEAHRLAHERKGDELRDHLHRAGWVGRPEFYPQDKVLAMVDDMTWWYTHDQTWELEPELATEVVIQMGDPRSKYFGSMRHETLPPDHLFGRRLEVLTLAVMAQLRARGNWHRVAREWLYGDAPVTELGRLEAAFYAARAER
jgi:predicted unusual protein kinase regulating ubiquinone biosynthesis (AarF/ABC1/UbiB family)